MEKTRRQLRAEAVERLKKVDTCNYDVYSVMDALLGETFKGWTPIDDINSLIDLLTDDELTDSKAGINDSIDDFDTEDVVFKKLLEIIIILADIAYFQKCMFLNTPELSESNKKACIKEAIKELPTFLKLYEQYSNAFKGTDIEAQEYKCPCYHNTIRE